MLVIDTDPVMPTDKVVRGTIDTLAANLAKAGVKIERNSPLLPDFAERRRLYMRMLMSFLAASFAPEAYAGAQAAAAALPAERHQPCRRTPARHRAQPPRLADGRWRRARGCARNGANCSRPTTP